jgi:hypothetical protein
VKLSPTLAEALFEIESIIEKIRQISFAEASEGEAFEIFLPGPN